MSNRNKKKGFLREMSGVQGTKTVFGGDAKASSTPVKDVPPPSAETTVDHTAGERSTWVPVVPPSEKELPSNVFVTHVEYQRRGWTPRQQQRAEKRKTQDQEEEMDMDLDTGTGIDAASATDHQAQQSTISITQHTSAADGQTPANGHTDSDEDMWQHTETRFGDLDPIRSTTLPAVGETLAWKVF